MSVLRLIVPKNESIPLVDADGDSWTYYEHSKYAEDAECAECGAECEDQKGYWSCCSENAAKDGRIVCDKCVTTSPEAE